MHCPVCDQNKLFRRWFIMAEDCPRCGLHFERIEGHWMGSLTMNIIVSSFLLMVVMISGFVITYSDPAVVPIAVASFSVASITPFVFFPASRTLWTAIDIRMRPIEPDEVYPGFWE